VPFSTKVRTEALARSGRHCALCLRYKGVKVEVHHIDPESVSHDNSLDNAIPLCFDCHADAGHYNPNHPRGNKLTRVELRKHRDRLWSLVEQGKVLPEASLDVRYLELLRRAFDRPAFSTPFRQEGRMEDFERAIDDTVLALNTGVFRTRDGHVIDDIGFGKSSVLQVEWQQRLGGLETRLLDLRAEVAGALESGQLKTCGSHCYCGDDDCIRSLDEARLEIIDALNALLAEAGIGGVPDMLRFRM
jgi:hypothetical protein